MRLLARLFREEGGQATLEYALAMGIVGVPLSGLFGLLAAPMAGYYAQTARWIVRPIP